jgi:hypothetical protein
LEKEADILKLKQFKQNIRIPYSNLPRSEDMYQTNNLIKGDFWFSKVLRTLVVLVFYSRLQLIQGVLSNRLVPPTPVVAYRIL